MISKNSRPLVLAVALTMLVGACGSDSPAAENDPSVTTSSTALTATTSTTASAEQSTSTTDADPDSAFVQDHVKVEASFVNGEVTGTDNRVGVAQGQAVVLVIESDVAEHVHVHGYDLFLDVGPGEVAVLEFSATIPGVFEIEFEDSGVLIAEIEVR